MPYTKAERLDEVFRRLAKLTAGSEAEMYAQLCRVLNEVEDEMSGVAFDLAKSKTMSSADGRMYPPLQDQRRPTRHAQIALYRSRLHKTYIGSNGSCRVVGVNPDQTETIALERSGTDGRAIGDL